MEKKIKIKEVLGIEDVEWKVELDETNKSSNKDELKQISNMTDNGRKYCKRK